MPELTRRMFLGTAGAALAATALPVSVPALAIPKPPALPFAGTFHPFLGIQTPLTTTGGAVPEAAWFIRASMSHRLYDAPDDLAGFKIPPAHRMGIRPIKLPFGQRIDSIDEAEDAVLARVLAQQPDSALEWIDKGLGWRREGEDPFQYLTNFINTRMNLIAIRTRRGCGQTILVHPDDIAAFDRLGRVSTHIYQSVEPERIGRWTKRGVHYGGVAVYSGPIPRRLMVLAYRPSTASYVDMGAIYSEAADGRYLTWTPDEDFDHQGERFTPLGSSLDFYRVATLEGLEY